MFNQRFMFFLFLAFPKNVQEDFIKPARVYEEFYEGNHINPYEEDLRSNEYVQQSNYYNEYLSY